MLLELRQLTINPSQEVHIRGVDLAMGAGEWVTVRSPILLLGTRLLQAIVGVEDVENGQVIFDGHDMAADMPLAQRLELRRHIGFVHRVGGLISLLNVRENIALPLCYHERVDRADVSRITRDSAAAVGVAELLDREVERLDVMQMRLVNLARALAAHPRLLLVDAILEGMDEAQCERATTAIDRYRRDHDCAVLMTVRARTLTEVDRRFDLCEDGLHRLGI